MLKMEGVCKSFGGLQALKQVSFEVEEGRIHGIIGPNGSGKTTMFNCITGMLPLTDGEIFFKDDKISEMAADKIANLGIRRTFQAGKLVPSLTVMENVMCGISHFGKADLLDTFFRLPFAKSKIENALEAEAMEILESIGMADSADRWAADLVWAERQFVQIVRAMVSKPKILLLDEPASGMGPKETEMVGELILKIKSMGITVLVVSHDMKMLMNVTDYVTVLNFGAKIFEGTPDAVQKDPLVLEAYLGAE
ncbi:MAG: ABC transporter ATP-binding protein [Spirochaetales bacterium]|nr:ABC transporter ATP-binding protein [Spirochaetales bacterium]